SDFEAQGGAISNVNGATLTVIYSMFVENRADGRVKNTSFAEGGAIFNSHGSSGGANHATIIGCTFLGNQAIAGQGSAGSSFLGIANGGALHNEGDSTLTVENSTFIGNQAIAGNGSTAGKNASSFVMDCANGGAVANDETIDGGALVVSGCAFTNNQAIGGSSGTGNSGGF